ncbi:DsbA family protein [Falsirhodobacter xinxiangensis]|uniref:DsbA family protein n=1 Tax=Falsirhodobacter xinxiangensis TaxID=2530049 RepID=UPI0010AB3550|nr:DsbA family protein [Rhodobacter xinxiangensis]
MKNIAMLALVATLGSFGVAHAQDAAAPAATATEAPQVRDMTMGSADAPIELVEYASYTCPHCADFHTNVFDKLKAEYIDTGKVRFVMREVYFDRYGLWAAMMARCGGDMRYFGISDILFDTQREWAGSQDPSVVVENLKRIGRQAGMDNATIDACMGDAAMAQALVDSYQKNAEADAITGTPTIIINGEKHSNMSYEDLKEILDAEL